MKDRVLALVAAGVAAGIFGGVFPFGSLPSMVATVLAVVCFFGAFTLWVHGRRRDKYDLGLLKEVHDQEEVRHLQLDEDQEYGSIVCPLCQTIYDRRLPACPNCGRAF